MISLVKSDSDIIHWPDEIVVIGGGRWASNNWDGWGEKGW